MIAPQERFWPKVRKEPSGCWWWTGTIAPNGYGKFHLDGGPKWAHRVSYAWRHGPPPLGLDLDHLCRNRACVNPDHLEPVTRRINLLRGATVTAANAKKTHCSSGHPYDASNTRVTKQGKRLCLTCYALGQPRRSELQRIRRADLKFRGL